MKHKPLIHCLAFLLLFPFVALAQQDIIRKLQVHVDNNGEFEECLLQIYLSLDSTQLSSGASPCSIHYSLLMQSPHSNASREIELDGETTILINNTFSFQHTLHVGDIKFWNDEEPVRYTFKAEIISPDGNVVHQKETPVAMSDCRVIHVPAYSDEFNIGGNCLCCNGEIIRMKGIYFDRKQWRRLANTHTSMTQLACQLKQVHANTVAFPFIDDNACRQWLDICDSAGLYAIPYISCLRDTVILRALNSFCSLDYLLMLDKDKSPRQSNRLLDQLKTTYPRQQFIHTSPCTQTSMVLACNPISSHIDTMLQANTPTVTPYAILFEGADTASIALTVKKAMSNNRVSSLFINSSYLREYPEWVSRLYQPCVMEIIDINKGYVSVKNLNSFTPISQGSLHACIFHGNQIIWEQCIALPLIGPREIVTINVPYELSLENNKEYLLEISIINHSDNNHPDSKISHGIWSVSTFQGHS